ncbi:unnamed protein product [Menidia menidia]|uniref:(Atlantic silverside) hypothetical protein n=1 Tax=Menidia menidia TaxID=238744 RepID=A0A8S4BQ49_9TELE|nr:unnamed protein product [Menidia menidia]
MEEEEEEGERPWTTVRRQRGRGTQYQVEPRPHFGGETPWPKRTRGPSYAEVTAGTRRPPPPSFRRGEMEDQRGQRNRSRGRNGPVNILPLITTSTIYFNYFIKNNYKQKVNPNQPYQDIRIITAFRKNKNLKDHLVRAIIPKQYPDKREINHNYFKQQHWIKNHWTGEIFRTPIHGNIDTTNCIYVILCNNCNLKYVGDTGRTVRARIYTHKQNIIHKKNTQTPRQTHPVTWVGGHQGFHSSVKPPLDHQTKKIQRKTLDHKTQNHLPPWP